MTTKSGLLLRGASALLALAAAITPLTHASAVNYSGGMDTDNIAPGNTTYPPGWLGIQYSGTAPSAFVGSLTGPEPTSNNTAGPGLFSVTELTNLNSAGTTGIGSLSSGETTFALVKEYFNTTPGSAYDTINYDYVANLFEQGPDPSLTSTDSFRLQYRISSSQLTLLTDLGGNVAVGGGNGWTDLSGTTFNGANEANSANFVQGSAGLSTLWTQGTYLYLRWYDVTNSAPGNTNTIGMALNQVRLEATPTVTGVPEPSTMIAGGLLLGCVAFRSLRRKSDDVMAAA